MSIHHIVILKGYILRRLFGDMGPYPLPDIQQRSTQVLGLEQILVGGTLTAVSQVAGATTTKPSKLQRSAVAASQSAEE